MVYGGIDGFEAFEVIAEKAGVARDEPVVLRQRMGADEEISHHAGGCRRAIGSAGA